MFDTRRQGGAALAAVTAAVVDCVYLWFIHEQSTPVDSRIVFYASFVGVVGGLALVAAFWPRRAGSLDQLALLASAGGLLGAGFVGAFSIGAFLLLAGALAIGALGPLRVSRRAAALSFIAPLVLLVGGLLRT
jgi:hypothetical protein